MEKRIGAGGQCLEMRCTVEIARPKLELGSARPLVERGELIGLKER